MRDSLAIAIRQRTAIFSAILPGEMIQLARSGKSLTLLFVCQSKHTEFVFAELSKAGGERSESLFLSGGVENLTNDTPPKKGLWTPPSYGTSSRLPPLSGVSALFFLYKNP